MEQNKQMFTLFTELKSSLESLSNDSRRQNESIIRLQETVNHMEDSIKELKYTLTHSYVTKKDLESTQKDVQGLVEKTGKITGYLNWSVKIVLFAVFSSILTLVIK